MQNGSQQRPLRNHRLHQERPCGCCCCVLLCRGFRCVLWVLVSLFLFQPRVHSIFYRKSTFVPYFLWGVFKHHRGRTGHVHKRDAVCVYIYPSSPPPPSPRFPYKDRLCRLGSTSPRSSPFPRECQPGCLRGEQQTSGCRLNSFY